MLNKIKVKTKTLPQEPGVYFFKNQTGQIIYIGKAINLRNRVKSYFQPNRLDEKTKRMVNEAVDFGFQITISEFEALLLEAKLIKEHQPQYNLRLKDGKRYLYIAVAKSPLRIFPVRRPELEDGLLDWYGPFPSGQAVREVLRILRRPFPYCSCQKPPRRKCFYSHLNLCPGWENLIFPEAQENVRQIRKILCGQTKGLQREIKKKMTASAKELNFEKAQKYKNQLMFLAHISQGWRPIPGSNNQKSAARFKLRKIITRHQKLSLSTINKIEGYDVSNLGKNIIVGAMVTFIEGEPEKGLYRKFKIRQLPPGVEPPPTLGMSGQNDPAAIHQIIARRFNHPEWLYPQLILVDGGKPQVSAAFKALKEKNLASQIAVIGLAKKEETIIVPRLENNQITGYRTLRYSSQSPVRQLLQTVRDESHRFAQKYYQSLHRKNIRS